MIKLTLTALAAALLWSAAYGQTGDFATGNMHFNAKDMDTSGDHMITREEMQKYAEHMWDEMAHGKKTLPLGTATKDFASAGLNFHAREIDTDGDGTISKEEFLAYTGKKFDSMKKDSGMVPVDDIAVAFARGNKPAS
jgi:EF hand